MDSNTIAALVGAVAAFGLTGASALVGNWLSSRNQKKSVRTLLSLEIDQNLALLNEFWSKLNVNSPNLDAVCYHFSSMPFPNFSERVFDSQLSLLTSALNNNEIKEIYQYYSGMNHSHSIHAMLADLYRRIQDGTPDARRQAQMQLQQNSPKIWEEVEALFTSILATGNPLQSKSKK